MIGMGFSYSRSTPDDAPLPLIGANFATILEEASLDFGTGSMI